jgi:DNA-binding MarR family transcriptional regulator
LHKWQYAPVVVETATPRGYRFGDLLALSRRSWVDQLERAVSAAGFPGYRRTDSVLVRLLRRGPCPLGRLTQPLGVSRQAARKAVAGLVERGFVELGADPQDGRRIVARLSAPGEAYAEAVDSAAWAIEGALRRAVTAEQVVAADAVLRAVFPDVERGRLAFLVPPPA